MAQRVGQHAQEALHLHLLRPIAQDQPCLLEDLARQCLGHGFTDMNAAGRQAKRSSRVKSLDMQQYAVCRVPAVHDVADFSASPVGDEHLVLAGQERWGDGECGFFQGDIAPLRSQLGPFLGFHRML